MAYVTKRGVHLAVALTSGTRVGSYEVVEQIGSGGMGEVWRATDTELKRDVALKVLPENLHLDPEALMRFEREARLLAALNHPNVATLHGLETAGDAQALVMELVEGESLDARIARTSRGMPVSEAIEIAEQIAAALDAAHERGIVHRDLKPANIKIRPDGTVKVLDFGVAKAFATDRGASTIGTVTQTTGAIVGTPSYMSPEQASGAQVDRRTDIWAFGCVLYEMLTGQRVFDGETSSRIVARVLERDPNWSSLPRDLPTRIRALLKQCLEKDVRLRRRDAGDLRLEFAASEPDDQPAATSGSTGPRTAWLAGATGIAVIAGAIAFYLYMTEGPSSQSVLDIVTPTTRQPHDFAVSPDGRYITFVASVTTDTIVQALYLRDLVTGSVDPIPGTDGARLPCWSPDSRSIAYVAEEYLQRVDVNGGAPQRLAPALNGIGCSWGENGGILFTPSAVTELYIVPESGGEHRPVTQIDLDREPGDPAYETNHSYPSLVAGNDRLVAQKLDLERGEPTGVPEALAESVNVSGVNLEFSASRDGARFAYRDMPSPLGSLTMFDRNGDVLSVGPARNGPEVSSDDRLLAYDSGSSGNRDVYVTPLDGTGPADRITGEPTVEGYPDFSPNGRELVYERQRPDDKFFELWTVEINRSDEARRLYTEAEAERNLIPLDWSVNDYILFRRSDRDFLSSDLIAVSSLDDDPTPIEIATTVYEERMAKVSPNGNWVVYDSNQPGRFGVFIQPFPDSDLGSRHQVTDYGFAPRWNGDEEIIFLTLDGGVMVAQVTYLDSDLNIGTPVELFRAWIGGPAFNHQYAVTSDGRFLINVVEVDESPPPIKLIQNSTAFDGN